MSPKFFDVGKMRFFVHSDEHMPIHVHIALNECHCKIELGTWKVTKVRGFKKHEIVRIVKIVKEQEKLIQELWHEFFKE
jgi:hypothetical protein